MVRYYQAELAFHMEAGSEWGGAWRQSADNSVKILHLKLNPFLKKHICGFKKGVYFSQAPESRPDHRVVWRRHHLLKQLIGIHSSGIFNLQEYNG
jgi:hypothetical protein